MRALIVDDSLEIREVIAAYLTAAGYPDPARSADAEGALRMLGIDQAGLSNESAAPALKDIDVILMDIMMPGMDGIEACARIKRHSDTAETPVLMVSSRDDNTALQQAFLAGASDYVRKPIERVELLARIRSALRLKAELDRRRVQEQALRNELVRLRASLSDAAVDAATGLASPIVLAGVADAALAAGRPVAVLAIAIDGFSPLGVLSEADQRAAHRVLGVVERASAGLGDLVAGAASPGRLLVLLRDRPPADVSALADRLRLAVERARIEREGDPPGVVTISIGLVHEAMVGGGSGPLLEQARRAAGAASARGGNRVERASPNRTDPLGRNRDRA